MRYSRGMAWASPCWATIVTVEDGPGSMQLTAARINTIVTIDRGKASTVRSLYFLNRRHRSAQQLMGACGRSPARGGSIPMRQ